MLHLPRRDGHPISKTVLIVDDEVLICLDIQIELEQLGHRTLVACSAPDALRIVEREQIDAAVVDWRLGHADASTLIAALRKKHIPLVLCSGSPKEELTALFNNVPVLAKPFRPAELLAALFDTSEGVTC